MRSEAAGRTTLVRYMSVRSGPGEGMVTDATDGVRRDYVSAQQPDTNSAPGTRIEPERHGRKTPGRQDRRPPENRNRRTNDLTARSHRQVRLRARVGLDLGASERTSTVLKMAQKWTFGTVTSKWQQPQSSMQSQPTHFRLGLWPGGPSRRRSPG